MKLPGFSAEASLSANDMDYQSHAWSEPGSDQVILSLPIGGYGQIACIKAICSVRPSQCAEAWSVCGGPAGGECHVTAGGPAGQRVTCCYAGDCTTFW